MPRFTVTAVTNVNEFDSNYGKMLGWTLNVTHPDGQPETITINSKPDRKYSIGDSFDAERNGREYKGVFQYKRSQPGFGAAPAQTAPQTAKTPQNGANAQGGGFSMGGGTGKTKMAYGDAVALYARVAQDVNEPGHATTLFLSILKGDIENPLVPKAIVRFMGNDLETAGVTQEQWDRMMPLCDELAKQTDNQNVRAILIASCGVESRKDLTARKAELFIETLRVNLAAIRSATPPAPAFDPSNPPF